MLMLAEEASIPPQPLSKAVESLTAKLLAALACGAMLACGGEPAAETPEATETREATSSYQILVTNDDGIESSGIQELAAALRTVGEVTVVAPCGERSGSSMSMELDQEIRLRTFPEAAGSSGGPLGHCVTTTPAGAVFFAVRVLAPEAGFDIVVSGINRGANVGDVSHMSGTIGGAMAGAYLGVPAVAASQGDTLAGFGYGARMVARFVRELRRRGAEAGVVYSINLPTGTAEDTRGVAVRAMGGSFINIGHEEIAEAGGEPDTDSGGDGQRVFLLRFDAPDPYPAGSDSEAYSEGLITITPLRFDWTDHGSIEALEAWDLRALARDPG